MKIKMGFPMNENPELQISQEEFDEFNKEFKNQFINQNSGIRSAAEAALKKIGIRVEAVEYW